MARSKYDPAQNIRVEGWARDGLTEAQIAHNLGVSHETLRQWKARHPAFLGALKRGKEVVDREVENALFRSALGFDYEEDAVTNKGDVVRVTRHQAPSVTAQIFWLKNRKPAEWRDKRDVEHSGSGDAPLKVEVQHDVAARLSPYLGAISQAVDEFMAREARPDGSTESVDSGDADA